MARSNSQTRYHLLALIAAAVAIKLLYFREYADFPFLYGPIGDSLVYLRQAHHIRAGNFGDPSIIAFSPLYGYLLAGFGAGVPSIIPVLFQFLLGVLNVVLIYFTARNLFHEKAALVSGILYLTYGMLLFYETKILAETLGLTLALMGLHLYLSKGFFRGNWAMALGAGITIGLAVLARANLVFAALLFVFFAFISWTDAVKNKGARTKRTLGLVLGMLVIFGANGLWNLQNTGLFVPIVLVSKTWAHTTADGQLGSTTGEEVSGIPGGVNPKGADSFDVVRQAQERMDSANSRSGDSQSDKTADHGVSILGDIDFPGWARSAPKKLVETFSDRENSYQYSYAGERSQISILRFLPTSFGLILFLGVLGAVGLVVRKGFLRVVPFLPVLLGSLATTTLYYPSSCYRIAMVLPLILLSGYGIFALQKISRKPIRVLVMVAVLLVSSFLVYRAYSFEMERPAVWELNQASSALRAGDIETVRGHLERADELDSGDPEIRSAIDRLQGAVKKKEAEESKSSSDEKSD